MPWKNTPETPNIGTWAQTDDIRSGLGWQGLEHLQAFINKGGVFIGATTSADFAVQYGLTHGVAVNRAAAASRVVGTLLRTQDRRRHQPDCVRRAGQPRDVQQSRR